MGSSTERKSGFHTPSSWPSSLGVESTSLRLIYITKPDFYSWKSRTKVILRATKTHAVNLAKFVSIYKTLLLVQKKVNNGKERGLDTFVAGLISGYYVFGERTAINEQVWICPTFPPPEDITHRRLSCTSALGWLRRSFLELSPLPPRAPVP